ncbi:MAG: TonB-dependent receptor [Bacteroidetes bacterium]|nr:TonB-dependent receptor [Bacteroidota bacterium]MBU1373783.1 TonB-dependent receptor [Bacteroidota bacterium]MBU1483830.1 TonB-dependent receptor [Bacteroidota bacterium]MBU1760262.1 TonB-dependent receptor [Bacteroidota bacterium]MBU2046024.1 TonB-dependent receptor [Bacteroidota bacterium]
MKRLYILICFILISHMIYAQFPGGGSQTTITGKITGAIIDSLTKKPVDYATISLSRSGQTKATNGTLADDKGSFKLENIKPGKYRLTLSFIGYNSKIIDPVETTGSKLDLNLGNIILSPNAKMLNEVTVTGEKSLVENKIDKIVYNAEKDVTISGGNSTDVLRKVPLLSVDYDGNLSLRGSSNVKVLINGKPSGVMAGNMADALKAIPADQIKSVEVITSPSAKYDAEGTSGIVNIITKKTNLEGVSGSINAGVGTRQNSGNGNLNIKTGRLTVSGNAGGYASWPQTSILSFNKLSNDNSFSLSQSGQNETKRIATNGSLGADYDFNNYNSFSSSLKGNWFQFSTDGNNFNQNIFSGNNFSFNRDSYNKNKVIGYDWNNDFTHKFKKEGQEISFAFQLTNSNLKNDFNSDFIYPSGSNFRDSTEIGNSDAINKEKTFQVDYVQPFKKIVWEFGVKTILRDISNDSKVESQYIPFNGKTFVNPNRNYIYDYTQNVYAGYTTFGFTLAKKYGFKLGARYEATEIKGAATGTTIFTPFSNNYGNLTPSFVVSRSFKNFQTLKLSYNKRIARPSLFYLNPFRNSADPYNASQGNPSLKPEISDNYEFSYSTFVKTTIINAAIYYRNTKNIIESLVSNYKTEDNKVGSLTTYGNIGTNNSYGFNFFGSVNPVKPLTFRGNFNVNSYDINVNSQNATIASAAANKTYFVYSAFVSASYLFPKGFTFETFLITNSPRRTFQGKNPSFNMWNLGLKKDLFNKKGSIGINVIDPFNERKNFNSQISGASFSQNSNFSIPFRSVGVNFSWRFGSLKVSQKEKGVKNSDLKQGDQGGGGGLGTGNN